MTQSAPQPNMPQPTAVRQRPLKARINQWLRWLHTYISMFSLLLILFFALTGITLNHPNWTFGGLEKTQHLTGTLPAGWQTGGKPDALKVAEYLRAQYMLHGQAQNFQYAAGQGSLSFLAPGYSADVQFDAAGKYTVNVDAQGMLAVANDFHKGRNTSSGWNWLLDLTGVFLSVVSLTGLGIMLYLKKVRRAAIISIVVGGLLMGYLMWQSL